jgi:hypothetical protein
LDWLPTGTVGRLSVVSPLGAMHRFSPDLDLSYLVGRELTFIGIDQYQLYLTLNAEVLRADRRESGVLDNAVMDSDVHIGIGGSWRLAGSSGSVVDESIEHSNRKSYQIHVLLGLKLLRYSVVSPTTLEMRFEGGFCLSVVDDSDAYESLTIDYGDTHIVV